jgi:hypothetical protein
MLVNPWPYGKPLRGWRISLRIPQPRGSTHSDGDPCPPTDVELVSGTKNADGNPDPAYDAAVAKARALGLARSGFVPDIARHIEIQEAASMQPGEVRILVIGKDPCGIDPRTNVSCHRFLPYFLPTRATLFVYGPRGEAYRYEGKGR